jgi:hypothetical protein
MIAAMHKRTPAATAADWTLEYILGVIGLTCVVPIVAISRVYGYGTGHWLIAPMDLPTVGGVQIKIPFADEKKTD